MSMPTIGRSSRSGWQDRHRAQVQEDKMVDLSTAKWRKSASSYSNGCVEVAFVEGRVAVRDSKDRSGPVLVFTAHEWAAFLGGVRRGEFDHAD
jgi:hypothetical protein